MAFGLPAHITRTYFTGVREADALKDASIRAVGHLGWDLKVQDDAKLIATHRIKPGTWGETIRIGFIGDGELRITSRCTFPLQCMDWGQNERNVEAFLVELNRVLEGVS
jgi:hypothetical protein